MCSGGAAVESPLPRCIVPSAMKKLLLALIACVTLLAGCGDREKYAAHRAERSKPKTEVNAATVAIRRAPYPNLEIQPDGRLRVDDIEIRVVAAP